LAVHLKHCKRKDQPPQGDNTGNAANAASTSTSAADKGSSSGHKHVYFHKNVVVHKALHPFHHDIEWDTFDIDNQFFLDCCECKAHCIIEFFTRLHSHPNHDNIKWSNNKLVVYNGKGWVEASEPLLVRHVGLLYSILEEKWFDYQSQIRCGIIEPKDAIENCIQKDIDKFLYEDIVDNESVFFHCKDLLFEYLERLKDE
jgi:hypothetical protein